MSAKKVHKGAKRAYGIKEAWDAEEGAKERLQRAQMRLCGPAEFDPRTWSPGWNEMWMTRQTLDNAQAISAPEQPEFDAFDGNRRLAALFGDGKGGLSKPVDKV
jgi:hypothetical protein